MLKDLVYKYSIHAGDGPPRVLYQGRDFEYYFSLPSGDPSDDYKGKHTHTLIYDAQCASIRCHDNVSQGFPFH